MMLSFVGVGFYLALTGYPEMGAPAKPNAVLPITSGLVAACLVSFGLAWYLSRPLHHLRRALAAVAAGDLTVRVAPLIGSRRDEIADLGRDFDRMADRLEALVETRQRLLHDVSHELRSPLTRMQAAIGLLRQEPERTTDMVERIEREAARLDALIGELLALARLEAGGEAITRERVDVVELLAAIAEDAAFEAEANGRRLEFSSDGPFIALVSGELICRAFENILRNAVKFTAEGTAVHVSAEASPAQLRVTVEDHGPGVPADRLEAIFDPFVRLDPAQGSGLGLAIARRAIEGHGGTVSAILAPHGGLRITLSLPASEAG
jgi:signal transduction histidine kinase